MLWDSRTVHCNAPPGAIPGGRLTGGVPAVPALADLVAAADISGGAHAQEEGTSASWSTLPGLTPADLPDSAWECACVVCGGDVTSRPSAPLGRLGVYVCMQPASLTEAPLPLREALVRLQSWTGHAPFRDVEDIGGQLLASGNAEWLLTNPLPRLVAGCRIRRALAGLEWGADSLELDHLPDVDSTFSE